MSSTEEPASDKPPTGSEPSPTAVPVSGGTGPAASPVIPGATGSAPRPASTGATGASTPAGATAASAPSATPTAATRPLGIDGLRSWIAEVDRKLGLRTYVGTAAVVLALATSIVAIVLAVDARDNSASNDDLNRISSEISTQSGATDLTALDQRLTALQAQVDALAPADGGADERLSAIEDTLDELSGHVKDLESASGG